MKGKGAASLYEVLKSASRPGGDAAAAAPAPAPTADAPTQTLQERLAAYKAQKLASVAPGAEAAPAPAVESAPAVVAVAEATPPPVARVEAAPPPPPPAPAPRPVGVSAPTLVMPAPAPAEEVETAGPGERVLRVTYNSAAFAVLVAVGLVFVAYAVGLRSGRRGAEAVVETPSPRASIAVTNTPAIPPQPPPPPPPVLKPYTIWLAEWKYGTPSERVKADDAARRLKEALDRANCRGAEQMFVERGGEKRLGFHLPLGRAPDPAATELRTRLAAVQKVKLGTQLPFAQAAIVELPR